MSHPFGTELRRIRRTAGFTLVDLAEAASCSVVYVSQIERGDKPPPSDERIKAMLIRLGCVERFPDMLALAARSRRAVEIALKNKSDEETNMLLALARKSEAGEITDAIAQQIRDLLNKRGGQQ